MCGIAEVSLRIMCAYLYTAEVPLEYASEILCLRRQNTLVIISFRPKCRVHG